MRETAVEDGDDGCSQLWIRNKTLETPTKSLTQKPNPSRLQMNPEIYPLSLSKLTGPRTTQKYEGNVMVVMIRIWDSNTKGVRVSLVVCIVAQKKEEMMVFKMVGAVCIHTRWWCWRHGGGWKRWRRREAVARVSENKMRVSGYS